MSAPAPPNRAEPEGKPKRTSDRTLSRRAGRLAAVQAIYMITQSDAAADDVLKDFISGRIGRTAIAEHPDTGQEIYVDIAEADSEILVDLVRCWQARSEDIQRMVEGSVSAGWPVGRLETLVRCILNAGMAELLCRSDIPPRVTISEFVDLAKAFYDGPEPGMVNAVLDRAARALDRLADPHATKPDAAPAD